jgi:Protein of unknown function (DUF2927)
MEFHKKNHCETTKRVLTILGLSVIDCSEKVSFQNLRKMITLKTGLISLASVVLLFSCSKEEEASLSKEQGDAIAYFKKVALGFEFGNAPEITRKWVIPMKIYVGGSVASEMSNELTDVISEINQLSTDGFQISITQDSLQSNCYLYFGSGQQFAKIYPPAASLVGTNWGLFYVRFNSSNNIYNAVIYVDVIRANNLERRHLLREELTQSLGLAKDSFSYLESIFQAKWTTTTEYSEIDKDLIMLLYHPKMYSGLTKSQLDPILESIIRTI